jgi:acetyl-CoA/propionyl-CoA carboxylase biotin carboxyl carrier protein
LPGGPGIRVDSGVTTGDVVTGAFDSLLAKLIVTGKTRQDAIERARRALKEFEVAGLPTVLPFHRAVLEEKDFVAETAKNFKVHTTWIENDFPNNLDPWSGSIQETELEEAHYRTVVVEVEGRRLKVGVPSQIFAGDASSVRRTKAPSRSSPGHSAESQPSAVVVAPMQATVVKVLVSIGQQVTLGDRVVVLEAMKMEQALFAQCDGVVRIIHIDTGDTVGSNSRLITLVPTNSDG